MFLGEDLLAYLKQIERDLGRGPAERWAPRPIDLDIVLYDDCVLKSDTLQIPHPRLPERAFVLRPLLDLDSELRHPVSGGRLEELLADSGEVGLVTIQDRHWSLA